MHLRTKSITYVAQANGEELKLKEYFQKFCELLKNTAILQIYFWLPAFLVTTLLTTKSRSLNITAVVYFRAASCF